VYKRQGIVLMLLKYGENDAKKGEKLHFKEAENLAK